MYIGVLIVLFVLNMICLHQKIASSDIRFIIYYLQGKQINRN